MNQTDEKAIATAKAYSAGNIGGLDDAWTRRLVASTVATESSGGDLDAANKFGYYGRYQGGAEWLVDAGLVNRQKFETAIDAAGVGGSTWDWGVQGGAQEFLKNPSNWNDGLSLNKYLQSAEIQDKAFKTVSGAAYNQALGNGGLSASSDPAEIAGFLKARHLSGYGGAVAALEGRATSPDDNGTSNLKYFNDIAQNNDGFNAAFVGNHVARPGTSTPGSNTQANPMADGALSKGEMGPEVKALQEQLIKSGITTANGKPFVADSIYGDDTKAAVIQYQQTHKLTVDGVAGKDTLAALNAGVPAQTTPAGQPNVSPSEPSNATKNGAENNGNVTLPKGYGTWPAPGNHEKNVDTLGDPAWGSPRSAAGEHAGFDIKAKSGDPVAAYKAGTVDYVGYDGNAGHMMQIDHGDGTFTMYQHLKETPKLAVGEKVQEGQKIAEVGDSGNAAGVPQLHFEVRRGSGNLGTDVNPSEAIMLDGSQGPKVKELQQFLNNNGYNSGTPDGSFGGATASAVKKWQEANGLAQTGVVDGNTFEAIKSPEKYRGQSDTQGQTQPQPSPQSPAPAPSPTQGAATTLTGTYREGDINDGVRQIQERLLKMGYPDGVNGKPLGVDGNFGAETRRAVETYQRVNGLESDGIVGPKTLASIIQSTPSQKGLDTQTSPLASLTVPGGQKPETTVPAQSAPTTSGEKLGPATKPGEVKPTEIKPETTAPTTPKAEVKPEPAAAGISASLAASEGILMQGSKGADVVKLQEQLAKLGYTDAKGQPVKADGDFGQGTKEALMAFEKSRGMEPNGIVGPKTFDALNKAEQAPQLSNANHPDHAMYKQADALLAKLPNGTFKSEQERNNAAGAVTYEAKVSGMTQIDAIVPNKSGNGLIATQGNSQTTGERIVVQKDAAVTQPVDKSTQMIAQDVPAQLTPAVRAFETPVQTTVQPEPQKLALAGR